MTSQNKVPNIPNPLGQLGLGQDATAQAGQQNTEDIGDLARRISVLESKRVNLNTDITGLFDVVSTAPTGAPHDLYGQVKIYTSGTTYRLYWYDAANGAWRYATGT